MSEQLFRSPGIFDREVDLSEQQQAPLGVPAGIIGTALKGPAFVPITVGSFPDYVAKFGNLDSKKFGPYAVSEFLKNRNAVTYLRLLGAGANTTIGQFETTRLTGQVKNAGFVVTGTIVPNGPVLNGHQGTVQFIVGRHSVSANEAFGIPIFSDNNSFSSTTVHLVRGMVLLASGARMNVLDATEVAAQSVNNTNATTDADGNFKILLSSSTGATFGNSDGIVGFKALTASLNPDSPNYISKILNTDPERFPTEQHLLYGDFAVDNEVASLATSTGAVAIVSGSANTSTTSGNTTMPFRDVFGHFDARYATPRTPTFISQPYGKTEYDLFYVQSRDDGEYANSKFKISIANIKKSVDGSSEFGSFTVLVRDWNDLDTNLIILEQFPECNLNPQSANYVAKVIGDKRVTFSFDAESDDERRLTVSGKYPNKSKYIRVVMEKQIEDGLVPPSVLPFGFHGHSLLKTNDRNSDTITSTDGPRLAGVFTAGVGPIANLTGSILPPVPYRFKVTRGNVATTGVPGHPGASELVNASYFWGVKFERNSSPLNPNPISERNACIESFTKFLGLEKLDALTTGSGADTFNNNKFTLAKVAFMQTAANDITGSAEEHMRDAAYLRNLTSDPTNYTVNDGTLTRITLASLAAITSSLDFNKFVAFNKFTTFMAGGFDGLNILDKNARKMNDKATSFDTDGGANSAYLSPGLAYNPAGIEKNNNAVASIKTATSIMTDDNTVNVNILAIPGIRESFITDFACQRVRDYGLALYVMDIIEYDDNNNRLYDDSAIKPDPTKTAEKLDSRAIDNDYVATYFPNVTIDDTKNNKRVTVPSSIAALAALGFNDRVAYPWFAPAGFNRAALDFVKNVQVRLNKDDRDRLQDARINPIATFPRSGFVIFGQKTLKFAKSALDRVNVRRLMVEIKRIISGIAIRLVFEPNNISTRSRFINDATLQLGIIQTQAGVESFKIIMDDSNNTQADIEQNKLNGKIIIVPTRSIEHIALDFIITPAGVVFQ